MANAAKRSEPEESSIKITNVQRVGTLRFCAERKDRTRAMVVVDIPPGETREVPAEIWNRYKDRPNIEAMDGVHLVVGGLKPGQEMKNNSAAAQALTIREKEIAKREAELAQYEAKLAETRQQLEAMREGMAKGH